MRIWLVVSLLIGSAASSGLRASDVVAITNVRIDTRSELGVIENGSVVIRDGVIEAVGEKVEIPEDAKRVDGGGATLTPGLIDSQSRLWLTTSSRGDTSSTAALRTVDGFDPFDQTYQDVVRQGVTSVAVAPEERGRLGGSVALIAAGPTESVFAIPSADSFEKKDTAEDEAKSDEIEQKPSAKNKSEKKPEKGDQKKDAKSPAGNKLSPVNSADEDDGETEDENETKESESKEGKTDDYKDGQKKDDEKEDEKDEDTIEVPYSITRPPVPYTTGKTGWLLSPDAAVQASLGIAATDGRSRISEFSALKKSLTDAESYHEKWDEYRSWKAKQDKLPPEKRAKAESKKTTSTADRRAEFMRRVAAMRAGRGGSESGTASKPSETEKDEDSTAKPDSKSGEDKKKKDDKKKEKVVPKPDFDPIKERLRPVLKGKIPLRIAVTDNASLKRALELAEIADCQLVLVGVSDLRSGSLDEVNWPVIAGPWIDQERSTVDFWKEQFARDTNRVCLGTFGGTGSDSGTLRMQAAAAVSAGVNREQVMDSVTRSAAEVAGVGNWLGKIAPGFRADLVLFAGDPLDPATPVLRTMIAGETVYQSSVQPEQVDGQQVVEVDQALLDRFADLSMPKAYVLASNRILRPSGRFRSGRITVVDGIVTALSLDPPKGKTDSDENESAADEAVLPVLNLGDLVVTPGLVTAHLSSGSGSSSTGEPDSSYYRAANGFDFQSERVKRLVESGVMLAAIAPPSTNVLAGQISAARLAAAQPIINDSIADKMVVSGAARSTNRFPASMEGQFEFIRRRFAGDLEPNRTKMPLVVAETLRSNSQQRFSQLTSGKRIAVIEAQSPAELRGSLRLIKSLGLDARLLLPAELKPILAEINQEKLGLIVRPARASDPDFYLSEIIQAASAGSKIGIAAEDASSLRSTAALMVGHGVKPQRALRILTVEAATCVGMPKGSATIAVGQPADLVVWSGPPYKLTSRCMGVLSDGKMIDQDDPAIGDLTTNAILTRVPSP